MKIIPIPVKIDFQFSVESVGTITGWLIEEIANFKLRPEEYFDKADTERILRTICKEMSLTYERIIEAIEESEEEASSDL